MLESIFPTLATYVCVACIFVLLRNCLDVHKGWFVEVVAILLCLLLPGLIAIFSASEGSFWQLLMPWISVVVSVLPVFLLARLAERIFRHQPIQISDLMRLTAAVAATCVVVGQTGFPFVPVLAALITIAADWVLAVRNRPNAMAIVFAASFVLLAVVSAIVTLPLAAHWDYLAIRTTGSNRVRDYAAGTFVLTCILVFSPLVIDRILRRSRLVHRLAIELAGWAYQFHSPEALLRLELPIRLWRLRPGVNFLNHGSFGAVPSRNQSAQRRRQAALYDEPIDMLTRHYEAEWRRARLELSAWLGTKEENIALVANATTAMNEIASWFPLAAGDEVLVNNHEYGAVIRTWRRACESRDASLQTATLPDCPTDAEQIVESILAECRPQTRLVILSHYTSPTAIRLPVERICEELKSRGIASCIDGPHALLQERVQLERIGCDFYTASCHKWLSAPVGSGFVYLAPKWHGLAQPLQMSWGRLLPNRPATWDEELIWSGTHDSSAILTIPDALEFFSHFDRDRIDDRNHRLAAYARARLLEIPGTSSLTPDDRAWYGWMVSVALPEGDHSGLQKRLWEAYRIEVPVHAFGSQTLIRISCHIYITKQNIDHLIRVLRRELRVA